MNERILQEPSRAGVYRFPKGHADVVARAARKAGLKVLESDVGLIDDRQGMLNQLGRSWKFPDWYGANLDALHDCLTDPDWLPAPGYALIICGLEKLYAAKPDDFRALIEVFRSAGETRRESATPFWVLLDANVPDIQLLSDA